MTLCVITSVCSTLIYLKIFTSCRCAGTLKPYLFNGGPENPGREQNAQQIGVNRPATSILNVRFIVWRQTPARYNWPLIRVRQKVNSSLVRPTSFSIPLPTVPLRSLLCSPLLYPRPIKSPSLSSDFSVHEASPSAVLRHLREFLFQRFFNFN